MTKARLLEIEERLKKATPGPWEWDVNSACQIAHLLTTHSGRHYVMDFARWGFHSAAPCFQIEKYEGDIWDRKSQGMQRADKMLRSYPGKEHHEGYDDYINHPDAELIANAPKDISDLIEYIHELESIKSRAVD